MSAYWLSCRHFTVLVTVGPDGRIHSAAPIVRRFVGQPFGNLTRWAERLGGLRAERLA